MGFIKRYLGRYSRPFFTAVACVGLEALCDLLQPTLMARMIDHGIRGGSLRTVLGYGGWMLLITACGADFAAARNVLASRVSQRMGADLRRDLFAKILRFSEASADRIESGSLITRMTNDTSQVIQFVNGLMRIYVKAPLTCLGSIALAVWISPRLSVILLTAVAVVSALIAVSMKMSYTRFAKVQAAMDRVNTVVQEYLMGVRVVKAFGRFGSEEEKFGTANAGLADRTIASQRVIAFFSPLMSLTVNVGTVLTLYAGSVLFAAGAVEVGQISAYISYMAQILASLIMMTNIFNTLVRTKASVERIEQVTGSEEDFPASGPVAVPDPQAPGLVFEHVTFAYPGGSGLSALTDLSFSIASGQTLAVIGPTGSGKSTLAWLCLRFYDPQAGSVRLNGQDLRLLGGVALRKQAAIAPQKSMLFSGTVLQNILWGNADATREEAVAAARAAQADGFIQKLPAGYDSPLEQGAINLSGGQKQRLSIARALVSRAQLLLLDDCTSALDAVTEAGVRRAIALDAAAKGRTVVWITQRIGTARAADRILVLQNGEKAGFGTHDELMASCKVYREIYDSQIGGEANANVQP
ncbi:MAG TPA: ABC transporter ATP-binding protein [Candidatus Limiplasma sp.]|nr:ABC transporter ATP-binding protein [Candidatus Limiplasma sp.]HPS81813.1 ABC transporter ATP-binding protein [Candidatus Limiplasma sp.]